MAESNCWWVVAAAGCKRQRLKREEIKIQVRVLL
jgi:hypothetical protein